MGVQGALSWFLLTTASGVFGGLLVIPQTYLFATLISSLPMYLSGKSVIDQSWVLLAVVIVLRGACKTTTVYSGARLAVRIKTNLRRTLLNRVVQSGPMGLHTEQAGQWIQTLSADIENVEPLFRTALPQITLAVTVPSAIFIVLCDLDWISSVIVLVTVPLIPFFMVLLGHMAKTRTTRQWEALRQLGGHFYDVVSGLTTLKWFHRSKAQGAVVTKVAEAYRQATMDTLKLAFLSSFAMELLATLGTAMVAVGVGLRLLSGHLTFAHGLMAIILAGEFYLPLRSLGTQFHASMEGRVALEHIQSILDAPKSVTKLPSRTRTPTTSLQPPSTSATTDTQTVQPLIRVDHVTYSYPGGAPPALDDVSLRVYPGERVAIVGPSGSGKSTLFSLLLGFDSPQHGTISVHEQRLCEENVSAWRHDVAYVGQRPHIFGATVRENLCLSRPSASPDEIEDVANQAGVAEFVHHFPDGYDTRIGSGGVSLSAGQVQRIALARALLKSATVWLLDEPIAHLDVESERWFTQVLKHLSPAQTVLVIAHRLSTIEGMEKLFLMQGGRVTSFMGPADRPQAKWIQYVRHQEG